MEQLIAHLIGDYLLQSHWMATNKTNKSIACLLHVITYGIPFLVIGASWTSLLVIVVTHFFIDRFRLARYVIYLKNFIAPPSEFLNLISESSDEPTETTDVVMGTLKKSYKWDNCKGTGYHSETPAHLSVWLLIIADNTLHLTINFLAIKFL